MPVASTLAIVIGVVGLAGVLFTALRFRRDDTTAVVAQQAQITTEMKTLNDELRLSRDSARKESDRLRYEVGVLNGQIEELRRQLEQTQQKSGKVSRIDRRADDA